MAESNILFRQAVESDLPAIVAMLAEDPLGQSREDPSPIPNPAYQQAFAAIAADPNQMVLVAEGQGQVVGCLQLSFIPGLSRLGMWRGQIEGVRIAPTHRSSGLGFQLITHAINLCRQRKCGLVQLTTDKSRTEAHRFYEKLGFTSSHEGMKLSL